MILTFESVDELLQCNHSNDSSSAVCSHGTIYILVFYKMKFALNFDFRWLINFHHHRCRRHHHCHHHQYHYRYYYYHTPRQIIGLDLLEGAT